MKVPKTKDNNNNIEVRVRFSCEKFYFGPGAARLLELIDKGESVSKACKLMNMSYSKGWKILNIIKDETGYDAVIRQQGGINGGKTILSEQGKALLESFRNLEKDIKEYAKNRFDQYLEENND